MNRLIRKITFGFKQAKMQNQLIIMYFVAVFVPIFIVGIILVFFNVDRLEEYHAGLLRANNNRVRSVMYEITSQIQNISDEIVYDDGLIEVLSVEYPVDIAFTTAVDEYNALESYRLNYAGVSEMTVYTNQKGAVDYRNFKVVTSDTESENWYRVASNQYSAYWDVLESKDSYGNSYWNLTLVRKITLYDTDVQALLMIKVSDNYLRSRIEDNDCNIMLAMDDRQIFYGTDRSVYGRRDMLDFVVPQDNYYSYEGEMAYNDSMNMSCISTLNMLYSGSWIYIVTMSNSAYASIQQIVFATVVIIALALVLPAILMGIFTKTFSSQVNAMRGEMYRVSQGDYDMLDSFDGSYELSAMYNDLKTMVEKIKEKDAGMYAGVIMQQRLLNEQQRIEFQMLASQINPHFLYNTLEMIRMKAIVAGDGETATAIKLLGKSMRYVLDNTGTEYTSLAQELSHIETYLQIQRLRFGDRVNYVFGSEEGLDPNQIKVLPLLLQPIVENAILHGLEEVESGGMIKIDIVTDPDNSEALLISISDNGCGMDEDTLQQMRDNLDRGTIRKRYGIGLYNTHQRIKICYGPGFGLSIYSIEGQGTTVRARIRCINV